MSTPRVILIGGPPGAGKTTLNRALADKLGYASLTVDDIRIAAQALTTPETHPALHNPVGHLEYFTNGPKEKLVLDAEALQDALWPAVERLIRVHCTVKEPMVIDWWLLSPNYVVTLNLENVASIWLYIDSGALENRERSNNSDYWSDSADPERMIRNFMHRSLWRNNLVRTQAEQNGLKTIHLHGDRPVSELVSEAIESFG